MKVLQLIDTLDAGGAERMAVNIANAIAEEGVTSYLCATRRDGPLKKEVNSSVDYYLLEKKGKLDIKAFRRFFKWLKKEQIQIIHAHSTSILLAVLAKINNRKLKIVWHDHYGLSDAIKDRPSKLLLILAKHIDVALAVNQVLENWSKQVLKIEKVLFLPNFASLSKDTAAITVLKGVDSKRVVCLANLRPQKNHLALLSAFKESIIKHPEWSLHLVGKSFDDEYVAAIHSYIAKNGLSTSIHVYGSCPDVQAILEQATIGVLASTSEGLPVSLLEYAMCGLPVIVTNVGQCAEVVGANGIVIENPETELSEALTSIYEKKETERELMGSRFRESVLNTYSKEAFMQKLLPVYKALIS